MSNGNGFGTGFVLGGIIGAIVGILIAPKSGSETRYELLEGSDGLRARAEKLSANFRDQVSPTLDTLSERLGPAIESIRGDTPMKPSVDPAPMVDRVENRFEDSLDVDHDVLKDPPDENITPKSTP